MLRHQESYDFFTGTKKYRLRNGKTAELTQKFVDGYVGKILEDDTVTSWDLKGCAVKGVEYDLMRGISGVKEV